VIGRRVLGADGRGEHRQRGRWFKAVPTALLWLVVGAAAVFPFPWWY
jgi:hypothetical protein